MADQIFLFEAQTTNANGGAKSYNFSTSYAQVSAYGTFDGASVQIQFSPDGGTTWVNIPGVILTATTPVRSFAESNNNPIRAVTSGGGGSMSLTVKVQPFIRGS
jgi:hypothetical protein